MRGKGKMFRIILASATYILASAVLLAQDSEKITVPLHNAGQPVTVKAHLLSGGITVKGYDGRDVLVEARSRGGVRRQRTQAGAEGMRRLEIGGVGLDVTEDNNVVVVRSSEMERQVDLVITVPRNSSLQLKCMNGGDIQVDHVNGEIDANNMNGKVTLTNVSGSVLAHSLNGAVTVTMDRVDGSKPMSFSTMNGNIDVTLPPGTRGNVRMKTDNGDIYSDFDVKLDANTSAPASGRQPDGRFHIKLDKTLKGTMNGGGPDLQFTSYNGQIFIRSKK